MRPMIPSLVTLTSLFSGCVVLVILVMAPSSLAREALIAACLAWSMIAADLDGFLARRLGAQTPRGAKLHDLSGLIAFGVAPPLWIVGRHGIAQGAFVVVPAVLWIGAAAIRMARAVDDGSSATSRLGSTVIGVPVPVAAASLVSSVGLSAALAEPLIELAVLWAGVVLMPSRVPYPTGAGGRWPWVVAAAAAVVALGLQAWP
jgi:CDP-diacylglycerol--serine O-phosphatidyltransferase